MSQNLSSITAFVHWEQKFHCQPFFEGQKAPQSPYSSDNLTGYNCLLISDQIYNRNNDTDSGFLHRVRKGQPVKSEVQNKPEFNICRPQHMKRTYRKKRRKERQSTKNDIYLGIQDTNFRRKTLINFTLLQNWCKKCFISTNFKLPNDI